MKHESVLSLGTGFRIGGEAAWDFGRYCVVQYIVATELQKIHVASMLQLYSNSVRVTLSLRHTNHDVSLIIFSLERQPKKL